MTFLFQVVFQKLNKNQRTNKSGNFQAGGLSGGGSGLSAESTPVDLETTVVSGRLAEIYWKHPMTKHEQYKVTLEGTD